MKLLFTFLAALLAVPRCTAQTQPTWSPAEQQIFTQLNQARTEDNLPALEWNDQAARAARLHTQALLENGKLSHQFPAEPSVPERIGATGARFTLSAENVARTEYLEDVHPALMNSPGHRANILNPKYNAVGIGVVEKAGKIYVTQDFIFLIATYSEEQFAQAFAEAFNETRKSKGVKKLDAQTDKLLHDAACSTSGDSNKLADLGADVRSVVVFTSSEPHQLPADLMGRATDPLFHHMNFGVCYRPDHEHGYANFWVVATFAD
ncbi:MAG TPA: CAP domain-containing protein [Candidatus Angelobacter sp.]